MVSEIKLASYNVAMCIASSHGIVEREKLVHDAHPKHISKCLVL